MKNRLKKFKAMVLTCMDPRFQPLVYEYLKKKIRFNPDGPDTNWVFNMKGKHIYILSIIDIKYLVI